MTDNVYNLMYQSCNLCDALHRNINDNFSSVSFEICSDGDIQVKIILHKRTKDEDAYVDDIMAEFSALQQTNSVRAASIEVSATSQPLINLVYKRR